MGCLEELEDLTAEGLGDHHTVLVQEDAVLGIYSVAEGPEAAEYQVVSIEASLLCEFQEVAQGCVCGCLLCKEGPGDGAELLSVAVDGCH